jgi:signal transduction histidine kinase
MKLSFEQKLRIGFWLLAVVPIVLAGVAYKKAAEATQEENKVARTNEIVRGLERLLSDLKDVEIAQREFIISGDERYVATIERLRATFDERLRNLRNVHGDARWVELLLSLVPQKFDEVRKTVEARREQGADAASQLILSNRGEQAMDDIRRSVDKMISEELVFLRERTAVERQRFMSTYVLFTVVVVLNLALIWAIAHRIRRERLRINALNEELEQRVAHRTEALQRSNEDLQQFAYVASHDLKEPMRMIASYAALLYRRYQHRLDSDADTYISFIIEGVQRMQSLITDLLEYSRAGESAEEKLERLDTETIVRNVLANLKATIAEAQADIRLAALPPVDYDHTRLTQVLQNLIGNAIKYRGSRRPVIEISARVNGRETVFSVKDNGIGIEEKHKDAIFGVFTRLHGKEYEGTGIGLATVKKIVERHGGRIWVESTPGIGSTFFFTVPAGKPAALEAATS